jgi:hypothetical protein
MQFGELDVAGYVNASPNGRLDAFEFHTKLIGLRRF